MIHNDSELNDNENTIILSIYDDNYHNKLNNNENTIISSIYNDNKLNNNELNKNKNINTFSNIIKINKSRQYDKNYITLEEYNQKKKNLIEIWCDLVNVPYNNEKPELFFNQREIEFAENQRNLRDNPIMLIQTNGGSPQEMKVSWMRDMPLSNAQDLVQHFSNNMKVVEKYGKNFRIIQIRRDDQPALHGVEQFRGNLRELMVLIKYSEKRVFIDSVCQHIAAALDKPSTVVWVRNSPKVLGYKIHDNIVTNVEDEIDVLFDSFLEPYDIQGNVYQCPFKEGTVLFNTQDLIESIVNQNVVINEKQYHAVEEMQIVK
jgi:hypothetical protein